MEFLYYPGCSLELATRQYDESLRAVFSVLGVKLKEVEDWNCCGATMYMSVSETSSMAVSARNLALAGRNSGESKQLMAPCSACYTVLLKTNRFLQESPELRGRVSGMLQSAGLEYKLNVRVRHPLDVLVNDVGLEAIAAAVKAPLTGWAVAPYYGCQIVRPERGFDDPEFPTSMDRLFEKLGAKCVYFPLKTRCCGGMLMTTFPKVCLELVHELLSCAVGNGARCLVTTCPLCQVNVEAYQEQVNKEFGTNYRLPILFFTQLMGMALGQSAERLGLHRNLIPLPELAATSAS